MLPDSAHPFIAAPPDHDKDAGCPARSVLRVFVIDEHEFVRRGLTAVINAEPDMMCCGELDGRTGIVEALARCKPDLVLVDVSPRRGRGLDVIQEIRAFDSRIRIMALAMYQRSDDIARIFHAGAEACVRKLDIAPRLLQAIRRTHAAAGGAGGAAPATPGSSNHSRGRRRGSYLDGTEREIVELIGRGVPARAIAVRLGLSVAMIEAHRRRIRGKLNALTATQLVEFCVRWVQEHRGDSPEGR